jgi:hypothetical protein
MGAPGQGGPDPLALLAMLAKKGKSKTGSKGGAHQKATRRMRKGK